TLTPSTGDENVQNDFVQLLTHRGATDGVREELSRCFDASAKWQQVQMFRLGHLDKFPTTKECIQQLRLLHYRKDRTVEFIDLFQFVVYRARRRWIREFTKDGGLVDLLSVSSTQIELKIFNLLFLLISFVSVLNHLVLHQEQHILLKIADGLSNHDEEVRSKVHQIFHVLCIYKDAGRMTIYHVMEQLEPTKKELLSTIINSLLYGSTSAQEAALRFLHALLDYEECTQIVSIAETLISRDIPKWLNSQIHFSAELDSATAFEAARCLHLLKKFMPPPDRLREAMDRLHAHATEYHVETQATQVLVSLASYTQAEPWEALIEHLRPSRVTPLSPRQSEPLPVHAHPRYGKYFRMLQVKVPRELVRQRMLSDGVDASLLETPDTILDVHSESSSTNKDVPNVVSPRARKSIRGQKGLLWHSWSEADVNGTVWPTLPPQSIDVDEVHVAFLNTPQEANDITASNLLDSRRSKVIRKLLHEHKLTVARVIDTIFSENVNALGTDGITNVRHILTLPTQDQKTALLAYNGPPLPNPEGFLHTIYTIPSVELLFDLLWTVVTFDAAIDAMEKDCVLVNSACAELIESTEFKCVLAYVLELGNHLNAGTDRAGASGFNLLTDLEKLSHVRQAESGTAMHFLAKVLRFLNMNVFQHLSRPCVTKILLYSTLDQHCPNITNGTKARTFIK
ncbi:hypothetical protein THRCLA_05867, partial [Thraustotheca clavata]